MTDTMVTLENEEILAVWGRRGDTMVYEGCHGILLDGRMCALRVVAQQVRIAGNYQGNIYSRG